MLFLPACRPHPTPTHQIWLYCHRARGLVDKSTMYAQRPFLKAQVAGRSAKTPGAKNSETEPGACARVCLFLYLCLCLCLCLCVCVCVCVAVCGCVPARSRLRWSAPDWGGVVLRLPVGDGYERDTSVHIFVDAKGRLGT